MYGYNNVSCVGTFCLCLPCVVTFGENVEGLGDPPELGVDRSGRDVQDAA